MVMRLVRISYMVAHWVMFLVHGYLNKLLLPRGGALCKSDMEMDIWLIHCLVLW
jgi:hypothetical protein